MPGHGHLRDGSPGPARRPRPRTGRGAWFRSEAETVGENVASHHQRNYNHTLEAMTPSRPTGPHRPDPAATRSGAAGTGHARLPRAPDLPVALPPRRGRFRRDDGPAAGPPRTRWPTQFRIVTPDARPPRHLVGRHAEVPAAPRRRHDHRVGLHSGHAEPDVLRLDAGGVRDGLRVLPDGDDGPRPQPDGRAKSSAQVRLLVDARSICASRRSTSCSWAWASRSTTTTRRWTRSGF